MALIQRFATFCQAGRYFFLPTIATFHSGSVNYSAKSKDTSLFTTTLNVIHGNIKELPSNVQSFIYKRTRDQYCIIMTIIYSYHFGLDYTD